MDLDQSGRGFQRVRTYLGPSLGWSDELVYPETSITTAGTYNVQAGDAMLLVNVPGAVTIQLPDVVAWVKQTANQPATGFGRQITVKDIGGNASNFPITIAPFGTQAIDGIHGPVTITASRATMTLVPLMDLSGWNVGASFVGAVPPGGGDVYKTGNNTFTGANVFNGPVSAPTVAGGDTSNSVATTAWVRGQNYLTSVSLSGYAPITSPVFLGAPQAPNPSPGDNSANIATTAWVKSLGYAAGGPFQPQNPGLTSLAAANSLGSMYYLSNTAPSTWSTVTVGTGLSLSGGVLTATAAGGNVSSSGSPTAPQLAQWVDASHIKGINASSLGFAPLASPVFTGNPTGPTVSNPGDNSTSLATTAFVQSVVSGSTAGVSSFNTRTGTVTLYSTDVTGVGGVLDAPNDGQLYGRKSLAWSVVPSTGSGATVTVSDTAPASPTAGQLWWDSTAALFYIYYNDGSSSQWVNTNNIAGVLAGYLPLTGGTLTGDLIVSETAPIIAVNKAASGTGVHFVGRTNGVARWDIVPGNSTAEGGTNTGSDFVINRYNDSGAIIDAPLSITRSTGQVTLATTNFTGAVTGPTPTAGDSSTLLATTSFVATSFAPLAAPAFTGNATTQTPAAGVYTSRIANTVWVSNNALMVTGGTATGNITLSGANAIKGTTTNDNAAAGYVGEVISATQATNVPMTTTTYTAITSISLTAGDWDVYGHVYFGPSGPVLGQVLGGINTAVANPPFGQAFSLVMGGSNVVSTQQWATPAVRLSLAATTTVYLIAWAAFSSGTCNGTGVIWARRAR